MRERFCHKKLKKSRIAAIALIFLLLAGLLVLSSCSYAGDTTTDHARNYVFEAGEAINFYDEENNRQPLGTMTFLSAQVLSDDVFTHKEKRTDGEGNPIEQSTVYRQIVQINYLYEKAASGRELGKIRFTVRDSSGNRGLANPDADYEMIPAETGVSTLVVALPVRGGSLRTDVFYSGHFTPNAIVGLEIDATAAVPKPSKPSNAQIELQKLQETVELLEAQLLANQLAMDEVQTKLDKAMQTSQIYLVLLSVCASVGLMSLLQFVRRRGREKKTRHAGSGV